MLAGLAFCEMPSQYPWSVLGVSAGLTRGRQQQFATQNPPRPFARHRSTIGAKIITLHNFIVSN